jgi:hypothetical protein
VTVDPLIYGRNRRRLAGRSGYIAGMKQTQPKLSVVPCHLDEAKAFVAQHHRHHKPPVGHKFSLAVADEAGKVRAVCIVGRPVARMLDDGMTLELTRLASDGCPNACSCLYGAAWRAAKALGYGRLITYILDDEPGVTLKAAGWKCLGQRGGGSWSVPSRPRVDKHPLQKKLLWQAG